MLENEIRQKPKMNFTPLIDIIFLLVVFFMLSTSFVKIEALNMFVAKDEVEEVLKNLSPAQKAVQKFNNLEVLVQLDASGISVNGTPVSAPDFLHQLRQKISASSSGNLKISVGEGVDVQKLVEVIDMAQLANAKDVQIVSKIAP